MHEGLGELSGREKEVLRLLLTGHDAKSAATTLGLSVHTVNERLREARRKLGVSSSREAARLLGAAESQSHNFFGDKKLGVAGAAILTQTDQPYPRQGATAPARPVEGMLVLSLTITAFLLLSAVNTSGEAQAPVAAAETMDMMPFADTDRDGSVSPEEYSEFSRQGWAFLAQGADAVRFADLDQMGQMAVLGITPNADGLITRQMYLDAIPARFQMLDRNGDNVLSASELNGRMPPP